MRVVLCTVRRTPRNDPSELTVTKWQHQWENMRRGSSQSTTVLASFFPHTSHDHAAAEARKPAKKNPKKRPRWVTRYICQGNTTVRHWNALITKRTAKPVPLYSELLVCGICSNNASEPFRCRIFLLLTLLFFFKWQSNNGELVSLPIADARLSGSRETELALSRRAFVHFSVHMTQSWHFFALYVKYTLVNSKHRGMSAPQSQAAAT